MKVMRMFQQEKWLVAGIFVCDYLQLFQDLNHMITGVKESMVAELFENLQKRCSGTHMI